MSNPATKPPDDLNRIGFAWLTLQVLVNVNLPNYAARIANAAKRISRA